MDRRRSERCPVSWSCRVVGYGGAADGCEVVNAGEDGFLLRMAEPPHGEDILLVEIDTGEEKALRCAAVCARIEPVPAGGYFCGLTIRYISAADRHRLHVALATAYVDRYLAPEAA